MDIANFLKVFLLIFVYLSTKCTLAGGSLQFLQHILGFDILQAADFHFQRSQCNTNFLKVLFIVMALPVISSKDVT